jgi:hypothetical protein
VQRQFRLGAEAGDELIAVVGVAGNLEAVDQGTKRMHLVEKNPGCDAEAGVIEIVVEDVRVGAVVRSARGGAASAEGAGAIGRQDFAYLNVIGIVVINTAADHQVAGRKEESVVTAFAVLGSGWNCGDECAEPDCGKRFAQRTGQTSVPIFSWHW